jgi:putative toxin-antitoxin system antitoxin component (TIGR02293 family)
MYSEALYMAAWIQNIGLWLGQSIKNESELAQVVRRRIPTQIVSTFVAQGLTKDEFHDVVIPLRTFKHRKTRAEDLSVDESDKALRMARVLSLAENVFSNRDKALAWMRKPKKRFAGDTPMHMLQTEAGARLVEQMLIQVDEGMFA